MTGTAQTTGKSRCQFKITGTSITEHWIRSVHCIVYCSLVSRRRRTAERTEAAAVVEYTQAPPATVRLQRLQDQMPTTARFMES